MNQELIEEVAKLQEVQQQIVNELERSNALMKRLINRVCQAIPNFPAFTEEEHNIDCSKCGMHYNKLAIAEVEGKPVCVFCRDKGELNPELGISEACIQCGAWFNTTDMITTRDAKGIEGKMCHDCLDAQVNSPLNVSMGCTVAKAPPCPHCKEKKE